MNKWRIYLWRVISTSRYKNLLLVMVEALQRPQESGHE